MSMRDYAVDDYGLVLDEDISKIILSKLWNDLSIDTSMDWMYELYNEGICEYISEFTGEAQEINDNGFSYYGANYLSYSSESIAYVSVSHYPTLFKAAYNNIDEIVEEFKSKLGEYLSEDFDYRSRIRHICGTYYG